MAELLTLQALAALATLTLMEIVLGVDNVVFIAILAGRLPKEQRKKARLIGLGLAALGRIVLLCAIAWIITLDQSVLFTALGEDITVKDLILILGGLFLLGKATWEIHHSLEGLHTQKQDDESQKSVSFSAVITQIIMLDVVFSIDSVLTAVGMVDPSKYTQSGHFPGTAIPWPPLVIMILAVVISIAVMIAFSGPLSRFIERHPTMKMLALAFLLLIGVLLVAEGLGQHIPRGYIYFAMGFSLFVELLNLKLIKKKLSTAKSHNAGGGA